MAFPLPFAVISAVLIVLFSDAVQSERLKSVCYFTNWSFYRDGNGKFLPEKIDANLCTHVVYSFAVLDPNSLTIRMHEPSLDTQLYKRVTDLRKKGIKVSIALGGGEDSDGAKYGRLLTNPNARQKFIANVIEFIKQHNFQGLDLDLEVKYYTQK